nr:alpha/beta hydrolase [Geodermatophilaceae bacterium]
AQDAIGEDVALVVGGRSSGARVAARTSARTGACGYLALAFPLVSPRGVTRVAELDAVAVPALVLQGDRDPFGMRDPAERRIVHVLVGADHSLRSRVGEIHAVTTAWLGPLLRPPV